MSTIQIISTRRTPSIAGLAQAALPPRASRAQVLSTLRPLPWRLAAVCAALALAAVGTVHAQALINQTAALAGNVTPGDTAGFPITISLPGSNLVVASALQNAVLISAPNVTLDLNGYAGVVMTGSGKVRNVDTYLNQMYGINARDSVVESSLAQGNGSTGFVIYNSLLIGSKADRNLGCGVASYEASGVRESMMSGNKYGSLAGAVKSMGNNMCVGAEAC